MVIIADGRGQIDSAYHTLVKHIPTDKTIVMVSWAENFVFNEALLSVKDYVLVCFCEYGWDANLTETHIWGLNSKKFPRYYNNDWIKFDNWVKENPPKLLLKRELLKKDVSEKVRAIDYPANIEPIPLQTEAEFNARPISAAYYFGRSHEGRLALHASIWNGASKYGYSVCDNPYQMWGNPKENLGSFLENESGKKYVSMHLPHWFRLPISLILQINGLAKIGITPAGAGIKTFRASEVSCNSVMLMWEDDLSWSFQWENGVNCIKCKPGEEVETIEKWTQDLRLYSIYCEGVKNWDKYRVEKYISEYINPIITKYA